MYAGIVLVAVLLLLVLFYVQKRTTLFTKAIERGPIRHTDLTVEQLNKIKFIHQSFLEVFPVSLKETVNNFKRDKNPDHEITIWLEMANAYTNFLDKHPIAVLRLCSNKLNPNTFQKKRLKKPLPTTNSIPSPLLLQRTNSDRHNGGIYNQLLMVITIAYSNTLYLLF